MFRERLNKKVRSASKLVLVFALGLTLTACGFHLRGNIPLSDSIKNMYIVAPDFKDQLESVLLRAGAQLAPTKGAADVVLRVTDASSDRIVGTLDERGKANSYNLRFNVAYTLQDLEGLAIRPNTTVSENRRYDFNPEAVLESESEEAELLESMEQDAALRIVRQLSVITQNTAAKPAQK